MSMKFEAGKFYRTRDGHKAQVLLLENGCGWMLGAVLIEDGWIQVAWRNDTGAITFSTCPQQYDIVGERKEPAKPKLLAPCLVRNKATFYFSTGLFESEEEAKVSWGDGFVAWPALPNKDGFYEVEVPSDE